MVKSFFCFIILLFSVLSLKSQEGYPYYNNYIFDNYYLIHPSMAGVNEVDKIRHKKKFYWNGEIIRNRVKARLFARSQWAGVEGNPQTYAASIHGNFRDNMALGFAAYSDQNGLIKSTGVRFTYAYHLKFSDGRRDINYLSMSLSYNGFSNSAISIADISPGVDLADPSIIGSQFNHNASLSATYLKNKLFASLTINNVLPFEDEVNSITEDVNLRAYIGTIGNTFEFDNEDWLFEPSFSFTVFENTPRQNFDLNAKFYYDYDKETTFWAGMGGRLLTDGSGNSNSLLTPFIGVNRKNYVFGYSYEFGFGGTNSELFNNTHQIVLGINLFENSRRF